MENEQAEVNKIEFNCAVGIIVNLMRKGMITPEECDSIEQRLKQKYVVDDGCAE